MNFSIAKVCQMVYNISKYSKYLKISRGVKMIILNLKLNNIYCFKDFEINFSYPKKVKNTLLENEFLDNYSSFRYKKLNIFVGSNASGKTSLIRTIWNILDFIVRKESGVLKNIVDYNYLTSKIELDFIDEIDNNSYLHRLVIVTENTDKFDIKIAHKKIRLLQNSSYENTVYKFDLIKDDFVNYIEFLNECNFVIGWFTALPSTEVQFTKIEFIKNLNEKENEEYLKILNDVFHTLDSSIVNVKKSLDSEDAYVIEHYSNKKIIVQEGTALANIPVLSSGTKYGFNIANLLYSIKNHTHGIYLIDEQFSYVNSDIESAMIATMSTLLGPNEQIFFTTHNTNILSLSFPIHSFYFLNKENNNISVSCASEFENRNNIYVKNLYDNDLFRTAPDVSKIYNIGDSSVK